MIAPFSFDLLPYFGRKRQIVRRTTKKDAPHQVRRGLWH
jgi:hypothetical protein